MTDFINLTAPITSVRSMCVHSISNAVDANDPVFAETYAEMTVAEIVTFTSTFLAQYNGHFMGFIFNENGDEPFAVVDDMDGRIVVLWDFKGDTDFTTGVLQFEHKMPSVEWAAAALDKLTGGETELLGMLREVFKGADVSVIGFDENGPFTL